MRVVTEIHTIPGLIAERHLYQEGHSLYWLDQTLGNTDTVLTRYVGAEDPVETATDELDLVLHDSRYGVACARNMVLAEAALKKHRYTTWQTWAAATRNLRGFRLALSMADALECARLGRDYQPST